MQRTDIQTVANQTGVTDMNQQLEALIAQALKIRISHRADGKPIEMFSVGRGEINGHDVEVSVIEQFRQTTSRKTQAPSLMFKVNGKRVSKANLATVLA
jgi:O-phosphoseryl-tRNA(Cys) synthetase